MNTNCDSSIITGILKVDVFCHQTRFKWEKLIEVNPFHATDLFLYPPENIRKPKGYLKA